MKENFIGFLILFVLFVAVLIFNALRVKFTARKLTGRKEHKTEAEQKEYAEKLGEMIRCETVSHSDKYDDTEFKKLRETVEKLFPTVHEKAEKKTSDIAVESLTFSYYFSTG